MITIAVFGLVFGMVLAADRVAEPRSSVATAQAPAQSKDKEKEDALEEAEKSRHYLEKHARKVAKMERKEIEEFLEEANEYLEDHRKAAAELPKLPDRAEPEQVTAYADRLAEGIKARRRHAKQGDILSPRIAQIFARILNAELTRQGPDRKVVLTEGNPAGDEENFGPVKVAVNAKYIPAAPLSTVPPTLLLQLPPLPKELEYRFVGRTLLLRDSVSNLIVDYIPTAVPK
jgi:hypothetical protein